MNARPAGVTSQSAACLVRALILFGSISLLLPSSAALATCITPPVGLTSWWTADGVGTDVQGGYTATLQGGATYGAGFVGSGAFGLDGTDDYVSVDDAPGLNFGTGDFTVDLWVNLNSNSGEQVLIEQFDPGSGGWTFCSRGGLYFAAHLGGDIQTSATIPTGTWTHVAARRASGTVTLFRNGVPVGSYLNSNSFDGSNPLLFGRRVGGQGFYLGGRIDEVHLVVGRALSDAEIQAIYNAGSSGLCSGPFCGNGTTDPGEACDDSNINEGDGCDTNCTVTACGNGIVTSGETCDDGNAVAGDGCEPDCTLSCGNGAVTGSEACDDSNNSNGDGCSATCTVETCYACSGAPSSCIPDNGASCDDGIFCNGADTCSGSTCTHPGDPCAGGAECATTCDEGIDLCADPSGQACTGDSNPCTADVCNGSGSCSHPPTQTCGDAIQCGSEPCDDGNMINGDGCDNDCTISCGNGVLSSPELCDDGNTNAGDGCEPDCTVTRCGDNTLAYGHLCDPSVTSTCQDLCNAGWSNPFGSAIDEAVSAFAFSGGSLYVGGGFNHIEGHAIGNSIAKWTNGSWSQLGSGMDSGVNAIVVDGTTVYAGGDFSMAGGTPASQVAKWNGSTWSALGAGTDGSVRALLVSGTDVYAGGTFANAGGSAIPYVAKWNGSAWSALGTGLDGDVRAIAQSSGDIYVGGNFANAGGSPANHIAKWNGSNWSALAGGTPAGANAIVFSGTDLYASGDGFVMKWNGASWTALATMDGSGDAMAFMDGKLYVGGSFSQVNGVSAKNIAVWDGAHWAALGSGIDSFYGALAALATDGTFLFVGGVFDSAGHGAARWIGAWRDSGCGEQCDDGNTSSGDGCDDNCTPTACGNGVVTAGETCDDSNLTNGDGCDGNCTLTGCGNGITTSGEACDDGNPANGDGCESDCRITPIEVTVGAGGTVGTPPVSPSFPVQTEITTPSGGTIKIEPPTLPQTPAGYAVVGAQLEITAPDASPQMPLKIVMTVDASAIPPGYDASRLTVTRNGEAIDDCDNPAVDQAIPSPCIQKREVVGGNVKITVLADHASRWSVVARGLYKDELKCVNGTAKSGLGVSKTQGKANAGCLKSFVKDGVDPNSCVAAGGKVGASIGKLFKSATKCTVPPPFGFTSAPAIGTAAQQSQLGLLQALFGSNLSSALSTDAAVASCQAALLKKVTSLFVVEAATFLACEKDGLAGKTSLIVSTAGLNRCFDAIATDTAGKIAKAAGKLGDTIAGKCAGVNLATALPGSCAAAVDVTSCLATRVDCQVCKMLVDSADRGQTCESFDDGSVDNSCN